MAGNKFELMAADVNNTIKRVYVGALRQGLADGFEEVVHSTKQDSSNTVVHWMMGATDGSNAKARKLASDKDLRGTKTTPSEHPWVGRRGEHRQGTGVAIATADQVLAREVKIAIDRYARGQIPATDFYFYNVYLQYPNQSGRAKLEEAGQAGLRRAVASFERAIANGQERVRPLK